MAACLSAQVLHAVECHWLADTPRIGAQSVAAEVVGIDGKPRRKGRPTFVLRRHANRVAENDCDGPTSNQPRYIVSCDQYRGDLMRLSQTKTGVSIKRSR
jgi:hypothetical protein